jgi:NTP pyrophosphatase (non-canonical NTP hydrolase)
MDFFEKVKNEYQDARIKYKSFNSTHEGIAVIQEEVDELWDLVKKNKGYKIDNPQMIKECIQIAAMVYAFVEDLKND